MMERKKRNNLLIGAGCILIATAIAIICVFGGKEADEICGDESPIGFFEQKHMPSFVIKENGEHDYRSSDIFLSPKEANNIEEKELEFCTIYAEEMNKSILDEDLKWDPQQMIKQYDFRYANAYADYYGLKKTASLTKSVKMPYIFDGGINCFVPKTQVYIHETNENYNFKPTIDLKKEVKSLEYFGVFASSAYGVLNVDFSLSLYKKVGNEYEAYHFTFPAIVSHVNTKPLFYGGYFQDFGINPEELVGCSMIGLSYTINSWDYTPSSSEDAPQEPFIKLYELLLPESEW